MRLTPKPIQTTPFGAPDADAADLGQHAFIEFEGRRFSDGLGMHAEDTSIRVIVGGKGAGKTHYLRRFQAGMSQNDSVYVDEWRNQYPATADVLRIWSWSRSLEDCRERWSRIWQRAILLATATHLLFVPSLRQEIPEGQARHLGSLFPELLGEQGAPSSIVDQLGRLVRHHDSAARLDNFLRGVHWDNFHASLIPILQNSRPIFFVLDGLDEKFEVAPSQWMDCQAGLLGTLRELRSHAELGTRLHVVVGVRDVVYSTTQESEHAMRHFDTPGLRTLRWDADAISYFLAKKIDALDADLWCLAPNREDPLVRWLGIGQIHNSERGIDESIGDYLIRHTRLIPRDIVQLGNALCKRINEAYDNSEQELHPQAVRETVAAASKRFGDEQLRVVANHVAADLMPREAVDRQFIESYIGFNEADATPEEVGRALANGVVSHLKHQIPLLKYDRVDSASIDALARRFTDKFGTVDVLSALWQHRLLGYVRGDDKWSGKTVFYTPGREDSLALPRHHPYYAFAPIVIDAVDGLRGLGEVVRL